MTKSKNIKVIKETNMDTVRWGGKVLIGMIPGVGGGIAEIYDRYVPNAMEQRISAWRGLVIERLENLEINIDELQNNPRFASTMAQCSIDALGQHDDDLVFSLLNAIESVAKEDIEQSLELLFLNYLRQFTTFHIQFLRGIHDQESESELRLKLKETVFLGNEELEAIVHEDLGAVKQLFNFSKDDGLYLTKTGKLFMKFISSDISQNGS